MTQFVNYLKGLLRFDFGESVVFAGRSVTETIIKTSPVSGGLVGGIALILVWELAWFLESLLHYIKISGLII